MVEVKYQEPPIGPGTIRDFAMIGGVAYPFRGGVAAYFARAQKPRELTPEYVAHPVKLLSQRTPHKKKGGKRGRKR